VSLFFLLLPKLNKSKEPSSLALWQVKKYSFEEQSFKFEAELLTMAKIRSALEEVLSSRTLHSPFKAILLFDLPSLVD